MMLKTHLAVVFLFIILFLPYINPLSYKILFFFVALISTMLPEIDCSSSKIGRNIFLRPLQLFVKHRNFIHSLTFCLIITLIFAFFIPRLALPFFLGYSLHLFLDAFTIEGITPFWPHKQKSQGKIRTGGILEKTLFLIFLGLDIFVLIIFLAGIF